MTAASPDYWARVRERARELGSDGCSWATPLYQDCCFEHDIHYRTHRTLDGAPITKAEADRRFRECIQQRSLFGRFSPMSWWRWLAVRWAGERAWNGSS